MEVNFMLYDIAVIGAGPAGSTAAKSCAVRGLKTLCLDRRAFPRPKTCGGGITTAALNTIGFPLPGQMVLSQIRNLQSFFQDKSVRISHPRAFMVIADRSVFDNFLMERAIEAGVEFRQRENVTGLTRENNHLVIRTQTGSYQARAIIGADGVHSTTAKLAGIPGRHQKCALCLSVEVPANPGKVEKESIKIFYDLLPQGYGWIFPKGDRLSVGLGCFKSSYGNLRKGLQTLAARTRLDLPDTVRGHYIPYGGQTRECVADGIILAGDAAGFTDPFTGEGIRFAIISGMLAGETLWNCSRHGLPPNKKNLAGYVNKCQQAFLRDLRYSYMLSKTFFAFPSVMHRFLFDRSEIYSSLLNILEGRYSYSRLTREVMVELPKYCLRWPKPHISKTGQIQE